MCPPDTTLVTLTRGDRHPWFDQMAASVPSSVAHVVLVVPAGTPHDEWARIRFEAMRAVSTPFVALLDDDDVLEPGAVGWCEQALRTSGAGLAFTHEVLVDEQGNELAGPRDKPVKYYEAQIHPRVIHHLAVLRTEAIAGDALQVEREFGCGFEWYVKARAALDGRFAGARQIARVGYRWRQRAGQYSRGAAWKEAFGRSMFGVSDRLLALPGRRGFIPTFEPT